MREVSNLNSVNPGAAAGITLASVLIVAILKIVGFLILAWVFEFAWNRILPVEFPTLASQITFAQSFWTLILVNIIGIAFLSPLKKIKANLSI